MGEDRGGREGRRQRSKSDVTGCSTYKGGRLFVLKWDVFFGSFFGGKFFTAPKRETIYIAYKISCHTSYVQNGGLSVLKRRVFFVAYQSVMSHVYRICLFLYNIH